MTPAARLPWVELNPQPALRIADLGVATGTHSGVLPDIAGARFRVVTGTGPSSSSAGAFAGLSGVTLGAGHDLAPEAPPTLVSRAAGATGVRAGDPGCAAPPQPTPRSSMARATRSKPAMFAPATRSPARP